MYNVTMCLCGMYAELSIACYVIQFSINQIEMCPSEDLVILFYSSLKRLLFFVFCVLRGPLYSLFFGMFW